MGMYHVENELMEKMGLQHIQQLQVFKGTDKYSNIRASFHQQYTKEEFDKLVPIYPIQENYGNIKKQDIETLVRLCDDLEIPKDYFAVDLNNPFNPIIFNSAYYQAANTVILLTIQQLTDNAETYQAYVKYAKAFLDYGKRRLVEDDLMDKGIVVIQRLLVEEGIVEQDVIKRFSVEIRLASLYLMDYVAMDMIKQGEYGRYITLMGIENTQVAFTNILKYANNQDNDVDKETLYDTWRTYYQIGEAGFEVLGNLFESYYVPTNTEVLKRKSRLKHIIDENGYLTVYRGTNAKGTPVDKAMSWTLSENVAISFSYRHTIQDYYYLVEGRVHIDDVMDTFLEGGSLVKNELEVLVKAGSVEVVRYVECEKPITLLEILNEELVDFRDYEAENHGDFTMKHAPLNFIEQMGIYTFWEYVGAACVELEKLADKHKNLFVCADLHGKAHTKRVLANLMAVLYMNDFEKAFCAEDYAITIVAAMLHDIGRVHDEEDYLHGRQSVEKYESYGEDWFGLKPHAIEITKFIMAYHNIPDHLAKNALEKNKTILDKERAWTLYEAVCDADGLERVRLHDIDITYLRSAPSKMLVPFAELVLQYVR